ncbi:MAG: SpoIID/LytB domain-containing protein [Lachnospiraceae bacterium]
MWGKHPTEEFLVGMVAAEIPAEYGIETMKAQAVLARTYVYRIVDPGIGGENTDDPGSADPGNRQRRRSCGMGKTEQDSGPGPYGGRAGHRLPECAGDGKKWGNEHFEEYYEKVRRAVRETEGLVAEYDGELIEPFYCLASAGKTRELAAYPYLSSVESPGDLETEGFLYVRTFTESEFADRIGRIGGPQPAADGIAEKIQIIERDRAGYVKRAQIGNMDYTGDEVRDSLGLSSSCFYFSSADGKIRVSSKGIGSGYGFSQAGADAMERERGVRFRNC